MPIGLRVLPPINAFTTDEHIASIDQLFSRSVNEIHAKPRQDSNEGIQALKKDEAYVQAFIKTAGTNGVIDSPALRMRLLLNLGAQKDEKGIVRLDTNAALYNAALESDRLNPGITSLDLLEGLGSSFNLNDFLLKVHKNESNVNASKQVPAPVKSGQPYGATIKGVYFTFGEISAAADFFSLKAMLESGKDDLKKEDLQKLKNGLVEIENHPEYSKEKKDLVLSEATNGRIVDLATSELDHFAPSKHSREEVFARVLTRIKPPRSNLAYAATNDPIGGFVGTDNETSYKFYQNQGLNFMREAAKPGLSPEQIEEKKNLAYICSAYADHFLADAFSAGHQFSKLDMEDEFKKIVNTHSFYKALGDAAWKKTEIQNAFKTKTTAFSFSAFGGGPGDVTSGKEMAQFLEAVSEKRKDVFPNAAVMTLHNRLNRKGVSVQNSFAKWKTGGDGELAKNPETRFHMQEAIKASFNQLQDTFDGKNARAEDVWSEHAPHLTKEGQMVVDNDYADLTKNGSQELVAATVNEMAEHNHLKIFLEQLEIGGAIQNRPPPVVYTGLNYK
jgi:hypothetical protein